MIKGTDIKLLTFPVIDADGNPIRVYKIKDECFSIDENCKCYYKDTNPFPDDEVANKQFMVLIDFEFNIKVYPDRIRWRLYDLKRYLQDIMERNLDLKVVI